MVRKVEPERRHTAPASPVLFFAKILDEAVSKFPFFPTLPATAKARRSVRFDVPMVNAVRHVTRLAKSSRNPRPTFATPWTVRRLPSSSVNTSPAAHGPESTRTVNRASLTLSNPASEVCRKSPARKSRRAAHIVTSESTGAGWDVMGSVNRKSTSAPTVGSRASFKDPVNVRRKVLGMGVLNPPRATP